MNTEKDNTFDFSSYEISPVQFMQNRITITFDTGKAGSLQISRGARKALGNPAYGQMLVNPKTRQILLMGSNQKMANAFAIHAPGKETADEPIHCTELIARLSELMEWKHGNSYRVPGSLLTGQDENNGPMLAFDLHNCEIEGGSSCHEWTKHFGVERIPAELLSGEHHAVV